MHKFIGISVIVVIIAMIIIQLGHKIYAAFTDAAKYNILINRYNILVNDFNTLLQKHNKTLADGEYLKTNEQVELKNVAYRNYITEALKNQDEFALDLRYKSAFNEIAFYDFDGVSYVPILGKEKQVIAYNEFHDGSKEPKRIAVKELSNKLKFYANE